MGTESEVVGGPVFPPGLDSVLEEVRHEREYQDGRWAPRSMTRTRSMTG